MATIRKRGNKWQVQIRRHNCPTVPQTFYSKSDAKHWSLEREAQLVQEYSPELSLSVLKTTKLSDVVERYIRDICPRKRSEAVETAILKGFLKKGPRNTALTKLSPSLFASYRDNRLKKVKPVTVRRELALVRHVFEIAYREWGYALPRNPLQDIALPSPGRSRDRRLDALELDAVFAALEQSRNPCLHPIAKLALETGMRQGELLRMCWRDIDKDRNVIHLPVTKNGHPRTIPLTQKSKQVLATIKQTLPAEEVFQTTSEAIKRSWRRAIKRAGISDFHFHDLRHEAVSRFFELGLSIPEVALISGHRDVRMLFRYTHLKPEDVGTKIGKLQLAALT